MSRTESLQGAQCSTQEDLYIFVHTNSYHCAQWPAKPPSPRRSLVIQMIPRRGTTTSLFPSPCLGRTVSILLSAQIPPKALQQHRKHICWLQHTSCRMFCCLLAEPAWIHCRTSLGALCQPTQLHFLITNGKRWRVRKLRCRKNIAPGSRVSCFPHPLSHSPILLNRNLIKLALMKLRWMATKK